VRRTGTTLLIAGLAAAIPAATAGGAARELAPVTIDYPLDGSIFPPEITPPTFIWHDPAGGASQWRIDVKFTGARALHVRSAGEAPQIGEIDKRCISSTNELPKLTPEQAAAHTWTPDRATWELIKQRSVKGPAEVTIAGFSAKDSKHALSRGRVSIQTSKDPVGAPIFYRDVPLMPSETEKGVIKPLAPEAIRLIQWRLRDLSQPRSRVVLQDMPTCANCHSFSLDGKTMGMDMDGPQNNKGLYALVHLQPDTVIRNEDMVDWNPTQDRQVGLNRVGFMSQVSPHGKYVVTTVLPADRPLQNNFYVVNFKDYRFLQVFYPTRGILAWYSHEAGGRHPLPGADDPDYVQTDGVWSPDGKYIVFARAKTKDANPPGGKLARHANDPEEVQIQYDLYRVPFNDGKGGVPERIVGASQNGMSNNFPKVSPDGRWIVFVECRNGQLMRPDSQLYIVPFEGGVARRMRANMSPMNSWHSFSPNGRWLVFSSKARSPYTQMYLTHIDEQGNDSPAILIENSTAANRAVNLPEFVNIPPDGLMKIETPAVDLYRKFDQAVDLGEKGQYDAAIAEWKQLLATNPNDARIHNNFGAVLARTGRYNEAIAEYERALELNPQYHAIQANLGRALVAAGRLEEAIFRFEQAIEIYPESADLHNNLGRVFAMLGRFNQAAPEFEKALEINSRFVEARYYLGLSLYYSHAKVQDVLAQWREALQVDPDCVPALDSTAQVLATSPNAADRNGAEAVRLAEHAVQLSGGREPAFLDTLASAYAEAGRFSDAVETVRRALALATQRNQGQLVAGLNAKLKLYEAGVPYRSAPE
jgi:tetratricopeptide (TPR) repeat protein